MQKLSQYHAMLFSKLFLIRSRTCISVFLNFLVVFVCDFELLIDSLMEWQLNQVEICASFSYRFLHHPMLGVHDLGMDKLVNFDLFHDNLNVCLCNIL